MTRLKREMPRLGGRVLLVVMLALVGCGPKTPPLTELTTEDLWERGVEAYNAEDWSDAIRYFDRFIVRGGADPRVHQARFYVAQARFNRREYVTAAADFSRLAGDLGRSGLADTARFMACRSYEELSPDPQLDQAYTRAALEHCQALIQHFPNSDHREAASRIVDEMWAKLAEKVYQTGEWYRGRRAYDSAIIYYDTVVAQYPTTRFAPRALARLVDVYDELEWADEREEVRERLLREYPESPEARRLAGS